MNMPAAANQNAAIAQPDQQQETPEEREKRLEEERLRIARDAQERAVAAARRTIMPMFQKDERKLEDMIAPTMDAISNEMESRREIAADMRDKQHEQSVVAAKLQSDKELKAMELDAMLKRLRMEQDFASGIKRFGPNKYGV